jgi:hypothetical protein
MKNLGPTINLHKMVSVWKGEVKQWEMWSWSKVTFNLCDSFRFLEPIATNFPADDTYPKQNL